MHGFLFDCLLPPVFKFRPSLGNDAAYTELSQLTADMFMGQKQAIEFFNKDYLQLILGCGS